MEDFLLVFIIAIALSALLFLAARAAERFDLPRTVLDSAIQFAAGLIFGLVILSLMPDAIYNGPLAGVLLAFFGGGTLFVLYDYVTSKQQYVQSNDQDEIRTSKGFYLGVILDLIVDALVIGMGMAIGIRNGLILSIGIVLQMIPLVFVMIAKARVQQLSLYARRQLALAVPVGVFAGIILGFTLLQNQPEVVLHILMAGASGFLITAVTQSMIPAAYSGRSKPSLAPFFFLIGLTLYAALKFTGS